MIASTRCCGTTRCSGVSGPDHAAAEHGVATCSQLGCASQMHVPATLTGPPSIQRRHKRACRWQGVVTELMPPEYGIVDGTGFYHIDVVTGAPPSRAGERVSCEGVPNTDGGKYQWRIVRLTVERPPAAAPMVRAWAVTVLLCLSVYAADRWCAMTPHGLWH